MTSDELMALVRTEQRYIEGRWVISALWIEEKSIDIGELVKRGWQLSDTGNYMFYDRGF